MSNPNMPETGEDLTSVTSKLSNLMATPEGDDVEESEEISSEDVPSEDDAPQDGASEENEGEAEPETPAIDAPSSWDSTAKERFKALPPDLQEYISTREQERERVTNTRLQEFAQARSVIEQEHAVAAQMRNEYEQRLHTLVRHLETTIPEEFKGITSEADLVRLADTNPALVTKFNAWRAQLGRINEEALRLEHEKAQEQARNRASILQSEFGAISQKWPEFADDVKGKEIRSEITAYARELGFSDDEISSLADHRLVLVLRDALAGRRSAQAAQTAKQKVAAKPLPKVVRPGSGVEAGKVGVDRQQARRAARSGDLSQITRSLERMLSS
jgi:hypothetical protein